MFTFGTVSSSVYSGHLLSTHSCTCRIRIFSATEYVWSHFLFQGGAVYIVSPFPKLNYWSFGMGFPKIFSSFRDLMLFSVNDSRHSWIMMFLLQLLLSEGYLIESRRPLSLLWVLTSELYTEHSPLAAESWSSPWIFLRWIFIMCLAKHCIVIALIVFTQHHLSSFVVNKIH